MTAPARSREPRRPTPRDFMAIEPSALEQAFDLLFDDADPPEPEHKDGVAVVGVDGPLESRAGWFWDGYGGEFGIVERFKAALADEATSSVVLRINSPGGATAGMLEAVDEMRAAAQAAGKPVVAFADGQGAYSAGYALATVAERIYVGRAGGVGSVGVIATAASFEKALEKEGVSVAVIASGAQKTDFHPALPITEAAKSRLRARVNELAGMFADEVARARGLSRDAVLAHQAAVFHGQAAVDAGLADGVSTLSAAVDAARGLANERAAKAAKEQQMTAVATILGLAANATEAEVAARAGALRDTEAALAALTGESSPAKALSTAGQWKREAAEAAALRERVERAESAERAAYINDVMAAQALPASMRPVLERDARANWEQFQRDFPRPSQAEKAAAATQERLVSTRVPSAPQARPADTTAGEDVPSAEELRFLGMTAEDFRKTQARMRANGVIR